METAEQVKTLLVAEYNKTHVVSALKHYSDSIQEFHNGDWEKCILKLGKFVEAISKMLLMRTGGVVGPSRQFKVAGALQTVRNSPSIALKDSIRLTIPRVCEFVYDVASNRGARHDPTEVNPSEMDAITSVQTCSWVLAEVVRCASGASALGIDACNVLVQGLVSRRHGFVEMVDGRTYFHLDGLTAVDIALLYLWHEYPKRVIVSKLISTIEHHGHSRSNASYAVRKTTQYVDVAADASLRLLAPGIERAESIFANQSKQ